MSLKAVKISFLFTVLSLLASALNFLYYPLIARSLNYAEFGEVQVGISFIMQAAALFTSLNILALYFTARGDSQQELTARLERFVIAFSLLLAFVAAVFSHPLASLLQIPDQRLLYMLSFIFVLNIPCATWLGSLQGNGQFLASGIISVLSSIAKLIVGLVLIRLGAGAFGAMAGILCGSAIILPLAYLAQRERSLNLAATFRRPTARDMTIFRDYPSLLILFSSLFMLALTSTLDVIFSKSTLDPTAAGIYAQLSTAGKIPYFAAIPLTIIFFERFVRARRATGKDILVFCGFVAFSTAVTIVAQRIVMELFFNNRSYDSMAFTLICLAFSLYSITTLLIYRLLAGRHVTRAAAACAFLLVVSLALIPLFGFTVAQIPRAFLLAQALGLIFTGCLQYTKSHEQ